MMQHGTLRPELVTVPTFKPVNAGPVQAAIEKAARMIRAVTAVPARSALVPFPSVGNAIVMECRSEPLPCPVARKFRARRGHHTKREKSYAKGLLRKRV